MFNNEDQNSSEDRNCEKKQDSVQRISLEGEIGIGRRNSFTQSEQEQNGRQLSGNQNFQVSDEDQQHQEKIPFQKFPSRKSSRYVGSRKEAEDDAQLSVQKREKKQIPLKNQSYIKQHQSFFENGNIQNSASLMPQFSEELYSEYSRNLKRGRSSFKGILEEFKFSSKEQIALAAKVISGLEKNIVSLPFRDPVNIHDPEISDYTELIKRPVDLKTIKRNLSDDMYHGLEEVYNDIQLIISNSLSYNSLNPDFLKLTRNFEKSYRKIKRDCERIARRQKNQELKKGENYSVDKRKRPAKFTQEMEQESKAQEEELKSSTIRSDFAFQSLAKLARSIRKMTPDQQIGLFKKISIEDTLTIDLKLLASRQVRILFRELDKFEKKKIEIIEREQNKERSHMTSCDPKERVY